MDSFDLQPDSEASRLPPMNPVQALSAQFELPSTQDGDRIDCGSAAVESPVHAQHCEVDLQPDGEAPNLPPMDPVQALSGQFELPSAQGGDRIGSGGAAAESPVRTQRSDVVEQRQGLRVGNLRLMIRYHDGSELAELPSVYRLPNAPAWFHGMANQHGALIPVFGLAEYLGLHDHAGLRGADGAPRLMLVMGSGADAAAVLIDGLPQRLRFRESERADDAPVPSRLEAHVTGTYWIDEQAWMDFKPADLFSRLEAELSRTQ